MPSDFSNTLLRRRRGTIRAGRATMLLPISPRGYPNFAAEEPAKVVAIFKPDGQGNFGDAFGTGGQQALGAVETIAVEIDHGGHTQLVTKTAREIVFADPDVPGQSLARHEFRVMRVEIGHGPPHQALRFVSELAAPDERGFHMGQSFLPTE